MINETNLDLRVLVNFRRLGSVVVVEGVDEGSVVCGGDFHEVDEEHLGGEFGTTRSKKTARRVGGGGGGGCL